MLNMDKPEGLFAIRMRIVELNLMYQSLLHQQPEDGTWDWWIKKTVRELEADLKEAKQNMAAPVGHHIVRFENLSISSISQYSPNDKESEAVLLH